MRSIKFWFLVIGLMAVSISCQLVDVPSTASSEDLHTQAAATIHAAYTERAALATLAPTSVIVPPTATSPTGEVPSPIPSPTFTNTTVPTDIPLPTPTTVACNWVEFIKDVTIPDGTILFPEKDFTKTWRLKNIGSCTWGDGYEIVFDGGNGMSSVTSLKLGDQVKPGQTIDVSVKFTSPKEPGTYRGNWMLRSANKIKFGIGENASKPFWVEIKVLKKYSSFRYDFSRKVCDADWKSESENDLSCYGDAGDSDGFVILLTNPKLENRQEDEPTLWTHPNRVLGGWIRGKYPVFTVKNGDHFRAWVGCLADSQGCNVTFKLKYQIGSGNEKTAKTWDEKLDGKITNINFDLSFLAGKDVKFILEVEIAGGKPQNADAFWFLPRIEK